ncbi:MAG: hypothetical protein OXG90_08365 [Gammaproteobacteria bacterium]|nr:hypothetical protein [Gammaproteobacteria bacterium]
MIDANALNRFFLPTSLFFVLATPAALAQESGDIPRLVDGLPDLQGTWDFRTITPLQRPQEFADQEVLTAEQAAEFETARQEQLDRDNFTDTTTTGDYNQFWYDRGSEILGSNRTSLITYPPDGRIPELTERAQERNAARREAATLNYGIEVRPLSERCIMGFNSGPPMLPSAYNNNVQLIQTGDHFLIHNEMVHNARIVKMNATEYRQAPRDWEGDSIGYWDGDTLVVETRFFARATSFGNSSENMELTEKFWLIDADTLGYEFTISDPTTWTDSWTAMFPMRRATEPIYEYACHEGNYSMAAIMAGWRTQEVLAEFNAEED